MIPLTLKEILALPAGPDLDVLVAEHVMEWHRGSHGSWHDCDNKATAEPCESSDDYYHPHDAWSPSTNPAAAWLVVNKMSHDYYWHAHGLVDNAVSFFFTKEDCGDCSSGTAIGHVKSGIDNWHWPAHAPTLALAVCRAALSALKIHEKPYTVAYFYGHP